MESIFLNVKFLIFIGLLVVVGTTLAAVLVAGVYQVVRDKVRESRRRDGAEMERAASRPAVDSRHL